MDKLLPYVELDRGVSPQHSIIWLHGLGADGNDFVPIVHEMNLPVSVRYIFPHAPRRPITINGGMMMRAWYDVIVFAGPQDVPGIQASRLAIEGLIAQEKQRGVAAANIYLAGFSQGGAMALYTGLHQPERLGGVIALSTLLLQEDELSSIARPATLPVFMAHGRQDPIIPHAAGQHAAAVLKTQGYPVVWHEYNMPHNVSNEEVRDIEAWLAQQLTRPD